MFHFRHSVCTWLPTYLKLNVRTFYIPTDCCVLRWTKPTAECYLWIDNYLFLLLLSYCLSLVYLSLKSILDFKIQVYGSFPVQLNKLLCTLIIYNQSFKYWLCQFARDCWAEWSITQLSFYFTCCCLIWASDYSEPARSTHTLFCCHFGHWNQEKITYKKLINVTAGIKTKKNVQELPEFCMDLTSKEDYFGIGNFSQYQRYFLPWLSWIP